MGHRAKHLPSSYQDASAAVAWRAHFRAIRHPARRRPTAISIKERRAVWICSLNPRTVATICMVTHDARMRRRERTIHCVGTAGVDGLWRRTEPCVTSNGQETCSRGTPLVIACSPSGGCGITPHCASRNTAFSVWSTACSASVPSRTGSPRRLYGTSGPALREFVSYLIFSIGSNEYSFEAIAAAEDLFSRDGATVRATAGDDDFGGVPVSIGIAPTRGRVFPARNTRSGRIPTAGISF